MSESKIFERATNPEQYDLQDLDWEKEGKRDSARTSFFAEYLQKYIPTWKGKDVLDIGTGNGWLLQSALEAGANSVTGIEPSKKNLELAKQEFRSLNIIETTFENFDAANKHFDVITAVMSFSHIKDLDQTLSKVSHLLTPEGELILVVPDFDTFRTPRMNYIVEEERIDDSQYIVSITRPSGTIADIVRTNEVYIEAAKNVGLDLVEEVPMPSTKAHLERVPQYKELEGQALTQLLRFKKV